MTVCTLVLNCVLYFSLHTIRAGAFNPHVQALQESIYSGIQPTAMFHVAFAVRWKILPMSNLS